MYFFSSKRARLRVSGGFFDSHKAGKSLRLVNMLWALNLLQFVFVLVSPSVFAVALYNGLKNGAKFSSLFDWAKYAVVPLGSVGSIDGAGVVVMAYLLAYIVWTANAYRAPVRMQYISLYIPSCNDMLHVARTYSGGVVCCCCYCRLFGHIPRVFCADSFRHC